MSEAAMGAMMWGMGLIGAPVVVVLLPAVAGGTCGSIVRDSMEPREFSLGERYRNRRTPLVVAL